MTVVLVSLSKHCIKKEKSLKSVFLISFINVSLFLMILADSKKRFKKVY